MLLKTSLLICLSSLVFAGCMVRNEPKCPAPSLCDPVPTKPAVLQLHGDITFDPDQRYDIESAAALWALQTSGQAKITVIWDMDPHGTNVEPTWNTLLNAHSDEVKDQNVLGWCTEGGIHNVYRIPVRIVLISDRIDTFAEYGVKFRQVALHELGHGLGLMHNENTNAIMYRSMINHQHVCLKQPDLVAFCQVNECTKPSFPCEQ